jgi:hypothetical protein
VEERKHPAVFWDPRVGLKFWLDTWSQAMEGYLRSAAFLELLQHQLQTMSLARRDTDR